MAFSPDGKRLASAGADGTVKVWDAAAGQASLTLKGHTNYVSSEVRRFYLEAEAAANLDHLGSCRLRTRLARVFNGS